MTQTPDVVINWTPLKDGVTPAQGRAFLVSLLHSDTTRSCGVATMQGFNKIQLLDGTPGEVIAWSPLPSPYWGDVQGG